MYVVGMGLVKVHKALIRLSRGALSAPFWCLCQKLSLSLFYFNKTLLHKRSWVIKQVPGPKAKSSSEITNPTSFTKSYHYPGFSRETEPIWYRYIDTYQSLCLCISLREREIYYKELVLMVVEDEKSPNLKIFTACAGPLNIIWVHSAP